MYIYMKMHIHICAHTHMYTYVYIYMYIYIYIYIYIYMYVCWIYRHPRSYACGAVADNMAHMHPGAHALSSPHTYIKGYPQK